MLAALEKGNFFFFFFGCVTVTRTWQIHKGLLSHLRDGIFSKDQAPRTHGLTLYPVTILMPTMFTLVQTVKQAVSGNFTRSQQSTNASKVYHVQDHMLKKQTLYQLGRQKASTCILLGELVINLTLCCLGSACRQSWLVLPLFPGYSEMELQAYLELPPHLLFFSFYSLI